MVGMIEVSVAHGVSRIWCKPPIGEICRCSTRVGMASPLWVTKEDNAYKSSLKHKAFLRSLFCFKINHSQCDHECFFKYSHPHKTKKKIKKSTIAPGNSSLVKGGRPLNEKL